MKLTVMGPAGVGTVIAAVWRSPGAGLTAQERQPGAVGRTPIRPEAMALTGEDAHGWLCVPS